MQRHIRIAVRHGNNVLGDLGVIFGLRHNFNKFEDRQEAAEELPYKLDMIKNPINTTMRVVLKIAELIVFNGIDPVVQTIALMNKFCAFLEPSYARQSFIDLRSTDCSPVTEKGFM